VCVLAGAPNEEWMRDVAREMNLSETAFLNPENGGYRLRWLTPTIEVDLCGHATLASAHVLWEDGHILADAEARFHTRSGLLTCRRKGGWIEMNFPAKPAQPAEAPPQLAEALGAELLYVGRNQFDYLVEVADEAALRALNPNHHLLRQLPVRGVIVTARGGEYDFVSRFFAPGSGIDEDPVTGSAHSALAPFWSKRLGKAEMIGFQASARGGVVEVRVEDDRVYMSGQAVTVMRGDLLF
jgi:PhzF family phenazine biosynthesis protein